MAPSGDTVPPSQLEATIHRIVDAYNSWDIDAIMAPRAPECIHEILPLSLKQPPLTNEQYRAHFATVIPQFQNFKVDVLDLVVDEKRNKVVAHARSTADTAVGLYQNEYSFFLDLTPDGKQILRMQEFVDSGFYQDFFARLRGQANASLASS